MIINKTYIALFVFAIIGYLSGIQYYYDLAYIGFYYDWAYKIFVGLIVLLLCIWPFLSFNQRPLIPIIFCYVNLFIGLLLPNWILTTIVYAVGLFVFIKMLINKKKIFVVLIPCLLLYIILGLFKFVGDNFGKTITGSPIWNDDKSKKIELISSDQGALGGATIVVLKEKLFLVFSKNKRVFVGRFNEYLNISWINHNQYKISK